MVSQASNHPYSLANLDCPMLLTEQTVFSWNWHSLRIAFLSNFRWIFLSCSLFTGGRYIFYIHSFFLPWQRSQLVFCVPFVAAGIKYFDTVSFLTHYYSNSENVDHPKGYGHLLCPPLDYFYEVLLLFLSFCCCFLTFRHFIEPKNERRINILQNIFLTWKTFLAMVNCDLP